MGRPAHVAGGHISPATGGGCSMCAAHVSGRPCGQTALWAPWARGAGVQGRLTGYPTNCVPLPQRRLPHSFTFSHVGGCRALCPQCRLHHPLKCILCFMQRDISRIHSPGYGSVPRPVPSSHPFPWHGYQVPHPSPPFALSQCRLRVTEVCPRACMYAFAGGPIGTGGLGVGERGVPRA